MQKNDTNGKEVDFHATCKSENGTPTVYKKCHVVSDPVSGQKLFLHFLHKEGTFYVAMIKARLTEYDKTFVSDFFYTEEELSPNPEECTEGEDWIWMPVENEGDRQYLFSVKPWKDSSLSHSQKKKLAKQIETEFTRFMSE